MEKIYHLTFKLFYSYIKNLNNKHKYKYKLLVFIRLYYMFNIIYKIKEIRKGNDF